MYLLNVAALSKPHAVEHLAAEIGSYDVDAAVVTETHFKARHTNNIVGITNYIRYCGVTE